MTHPEASLSELAKLRGREKLIAMFWGVVRVFTVFVVLLILACCIDRWIDMHRETPRGLRIAMSITQAVAFALVVYFWILTPLVKKLSDDELAIRVEQQLPEYGHRLVTAIQLNRESAQTSGMSRELIVALTREAEQVSDGNDLRSVADTRRLVWGSLLIIVPILVALGFMAWLRFDTNLAGILIQRQFLSNREIPHQISLENVTDTLWPAGDEVIVKYRVNFKHYVEQGRIGTVRVVPEGMPGDEYSLEFNEKIDDHNAYFIAKVQPMTLNFRHRAWLGDGRTRNWSDVTFEPRPVVTNISAWVQLPDFVGRKPDGSPYESLMNQGEVIGLPGSKVRVLIRAQKPLSEANLVLLQRDKNIGTEKALPPVPMQLLNERDEGTGEILYGAEASFTVDTSLLAYRIDVKDQFAFANSSPPRRGIALAPDEPPHVTLLAERFADVGELATEDTEVEGMPIPQGKSIRISYSAQSPLGLRAARLVYRINEGDWNYLPLKESKASETTGEFDIRRGVFAKSGIADEVEFARVPSIDPQEKPGDLEGGGRFDFKTKTLQKLDAEKKLVAIEVGDRIEFYVEVFDKDPSIKTPGTAERGRLGRSEARIKGIVTDSQFVDWVLQTLQSESRLKQLEEKQKGIFQPR